GKTAKPPFKGVWDGIAYTYRTTGFFSLYSGLSITLLFSIPKAGIRFGGNAWCKKALADVDGKLTVGRQFLAGFGAGVIEAVAAVTPMESIKTFAIEKNAGLVSAVKGIVQTSGLKGLYKGVVPTVAKQASNQGLRFMFYNYYKDLYTQDGKRPLPPLGALLGGMLAGCFSTTCNNPFDVVKTRMQGSNSHQYTSMIDCVWK
ncbi:SLC25A1, partial [Symbiodinium microadriaticum]